MLKGKKINKKNIGILIGVIALIVIAIVVFTKMSPSVGEYKLLSIVDSDGQVMQEELEVLEENNLSISLKLDKEHNGTFHLFGQDVPITWTNKEIVMNGEKLPIKYNKHSFQVKDPSGGNSTLVFEKIK